MFHFYSQEMLRDRQRDFESYEYTEVFEADVAGDNVVGLEKNTFKFQMKDKEAIYNMADSYMEIGFDILTAKNGVPVTSGLIAPVNGCWNLFKDSKFKFGNRTIEEADKCGEIAQIKGLQKYSDDYTRAQGKTSLWAPDRFTDKIEEPLQIFARVVGKNCGILPVFIDTNLLGVGPVPANDPAFQALAVNDIIQLFIVTNHGPMEIDVFVNENIQAIPITYTSTKVLFAANNVGAGVAELKFVNANPNNIGGFDDYVAGGANNTARRSIDLFCRGYEVSLYSADGLSLPKLTFTGNGAGAAAFPILLVGADTPEITTVIGWDSGVSNIGFYERLRRGMTKSGELGSYQIFAPLRELVAFWEQNPILLRGLVSELELKRNDFSETVLCDASASAFLGDNGGYIKFNKMKLWVPVVRPTLSMQSRLIDSFNDSTPKILRWDYPESFESNTYAGTEKKAVWRIVSITKRPVRAVIYFKKDSRKDKDENNMCFDNIDLSELYIQLGNRSMKYPELPYQPDYQTNEYMREYNAYLSSCGLTHSYECKPIISYEEFGSLYPIYCISLENLEEGIFENITDLEIKVSWKLRSEPGAPYRAYAVIETERQIEIGGANGSVVLLKNTDE